MSGVRLETPRLVLRPFTRSDLAEFQKIASQEEVLRYLPAGDRMTLEEMKETLDWLIDCYARNTPGRMLKFTLPAILKESGEIIGWCGLGPLEFDESRIEIFFILSPEVWGRGLATEAAGALLSYAFDCLQLSRIVAVVNPENVASIQVLRKLGMEPDGSVRGLPAIHSHYEGHLLFVIDERRFRSRV